MLPIARYRYLIVGCGVAGISAAEAIRAVDPDGSLAIVSEDPFGYYSRPGLAYLLTREIPENFLFPFSRDELKALRVDWITDRVAALDPAGRRALLARRGSVAYERLLLATGSQAALPRLPGIGLSGVVKLDTLEDARCIAQLSRKAKKAVVVGGGITALELVEGLVAHKVKVHHFLRGERFWSNVLDEVESRLVEQRLQAEGVTLHFHTELDSIQGERGRVRAVCTKDGRTLPVDMVGVAVGIRARTELAAAAALQTERGILVDQQMRTSAADVFAAGDVAQVYDPFTQSYVLDSLWAPAREMGRVAGTNIAGGSLVYAKTLPINVTRLAGLTTTIIGAVGGGQDADLAGIAHGDSEIWRQAPDAIVAQNNFAVNRLRLMVGKETLLGAVVMGDQTLSQPLQALILGKADISPLREQLLECQPEMPLLLANFWEEWRRTHAA